MLLKPWALGQPSLHTEQVEQFILVRDDSVRKDIAEHIGEEALGYDSGLGYSFFVRGCLTYNFWNAPFKESMESFLWVYEGTNLLNSNDGKFPMFSNAKHQILCSELKQLYVAVARTRKRQWICENIDDFSKPVFELEEVISRSS
ncbi:hypothetical protein C5167_030908 [Papaver somniferum]|nr:hypothetical protein C5167_030908 [Papaver somniferum]